MSYREIKGSVFRGFRRNKDGQDDPQRENY